MRELDCIVIGGGAAGLMCAATAGKRGRSVVVLEHANKVGKKILMSGGGRCNFTNYDIGPANYLSDNPHFCKSALSRYTQWDFIALVSQHGLAYHEKTLGQLFCDNKARDLLDILLAECQSAGAEIHTRCSIERVEPLGENAGFKVFTSQGLYQCQSLVVATGGLSIPTMGATGFGYQLAEQFGLSVTRKDAALVPFTLTGDNLTLCQSLAGVSLPAVVECNGQRFAEALLFTHRGISGPAALQISNYWYPGDTVHIDWLPGSDLGELARQWRDQGARARSINLLSQVLPRRFVQQWLHFNQLQALEDKPAAQWSNRDIEAIADCIHRWAMTPDATEGYRTAEVTRGGVNTDGVSSKTFEAKTAPGLYFIGEVLDVTGWLGGYNFQWAWASGHCCGQYV